MADVDVGSLVSRVELLEGAIQDLHTIVKAQAQMIKAQQETATGKGGGLTMEQLKAMSPEEINARWDEVRKALGGQK